MRTTVDIPDELFREAKAGAAIEGRTLEELVTEALREQLRRRHERELAERGWRSVFGKAKRADVAKVQSIIDDELSRIEPEAWR